MYTVVTSRWTIAGVQRGYTRIKYLGELTTSECSTAVGKNKSFFEGLVSYLPANVSVAHDSLCEHYDDFGEKQDVVTAGTGQANSVGTGAGAYPNGAGAWINWVASQFVAGRRVVGRTFLVPLYTSAYQNDGTLAAAFVTALQGLGTTLITGFPNVVIRYDRTDKKGTRFQGTSTVQAVNVKDKAGILRSRRG